VKTSLENVEGSADRPKRSVVRRIASVLQWIVNVAVLLAVVLVFTPAGDWLGDALIDVDELTDKADYIVVLGGHNERGVEAANLYRQGWAPKIIVTSTLRDATTLAEIVKAYGVPGQDILIDSAPTRTADHARTVAQVPGADKDTDRFIVLTSPYHTSRAKACFHRAGYRHVCMQSPSWKVGGSRGPAELGWIHRALTLSTKLYEVLAWAMYRVRGWL